MSICATIIVVTIPIIPCGKSAYIEGSGKVSTTFDKESEMITSTYPDEMVEEITAWEVAAQWYAVRAENQTVDQSTIPL